MLTAKTGHKDRIFMVQLEGMVDDSAELGQVIGPVPPAPVDFYVNCSKINRINSVGVKGWIKYFQEMKSKVSSLTFLDCSPPIVQQLNAVFNFAAGGKVASIQLSFACESCGNTFVLTMPTAQIVAAKYMIPDQKCPKCSGQAEFDDLPKMYFKFLMNQPVAKTSIPKAGTTKPIK